MTGELNKNTKNALGISGRSIEVVGVETKSGSEMDLYEQSYALLVGVSDYSKGWPSLNHIPSEVEKVENILHSQGFQVEKVINPDEQELENTFSNFIDDYGYNKKNRLLFYYAGHGYTMDNGQEGYLVPTNAPNPREQKIDFKRKSLNMAQVISWCKQMDVKHALFLFDSCFSGTIFKQRDLPDTPPEIKTLIKKPVRQFITAGTAGESVPADSTFTPAFVDAIKYGLGDLNKDGYISGTELGLYLQKKVPKHTSQTPQYGKITDYELSRGDFVFLAGGSAEVNVPSQESRDQQEKDTGSLQVSTNPSGAKIYIDKEYKSKAPVSLSDLSLGPTTIKAKKEGYRDQEKSAYIRSDKEIKLTLVLDKIDTTGSLDVESDPRDAKWYLDGAYAGKTPDSMQGVEKGRHKVKVVKDGYKKWSGSVYISAGDEKHISADLKSERSRHQAGDTWTDPETGMEFVWVPGGCYQMGCGSWTDSCDDDEKPVHEVCVDGFWISKYEVTQGEWEQIMGNNPSHFDNGDNYPVEEVSWNDCQDFIDNLNSESSKTFRLPTEAEWEYAARSGGKQQKYAGGGDVDSVAWYGGNSGDQTHEVGTKAPNDLGIYDMSGNVWEWCSDWYSSDYYSNSPKNNPQGPSSGSYRVGRGGGWDSVAEYVRAVIRVYGVPSYTYVGIGLRLVRTAD